MAALVGVFALLQVMFLLLVAMLGGKLATRLSEQLTKDPRRPVTIPPLLFMLFAGLILENVPGGLLRHVSNDLSSVLRKIALTIILLRAGLGLNLASLRRTGAATLRLSCIPAFSEAGVVAVLARVLLGLSWGFSVALGFVVGAVSPAVVVPSLLALQEEGYGVAKGIPTMILAAASVDDVIAISAFGVALGLAFNAEGINPGGNSSLGLAIGLAFIQIFGGIFVGYLLGRLSGLIGVRRSAAEAPVGDDVAGSRIRKAVPEAIRSSSVDGLKLSLFRVTFLLAIGLCVVFVASEYQASGGGFLTCMVMGATVAPLWDVRIGEAAREGEKRGEPLQVAFRTKGVSAWLGLAWWYFQPLLFGLIGASVRVADIEGDTIGFGVAILAVSLTVRLLVTYLTMLGTDLVQLERLFVAVAWLPKATVQAAIGSEALDVANDEDASDEVTDWAKDILTIAVLSILLTAPLGALLIAFTGRNWLEKQEDPERGQRVMIVTEDAKEAEDQLSKG